MITQFAGPQTEPPVPLGRAIADRWLTPGLPLNPRTYLSAGRFDLILMKEPRETRRQTERKCGPVNGEVMNDSKTELKWRFWGCGMAARCGAAQRFLQAGSFLLLVAFAPSYAVAQSTSNISDILSGQRFMKQTDDLSFLSVYLQPNGITTNYDVITFDTSNSGFPGGNTPSYQQTIATTTSLTPANQLPSAQSAAVASGRMFNTQNDQFMSISVANDSQFGPVTPYWSFYYYNPPVSGAAGHPAYVDQQGVQNTKVPSANGYNFAWLAMGDFRGDGLKEGVAVYENINNNTVQWGIDILGALINQGNAPPLNSLGEGPELYTSAQLSEP